MELRTLQYFLAIAQEESITKAAENVLHVTQPTLSRQIAELEAELGTTLFMRTNKKTLLTDAGLRFRRHAQEIADMISRMQADFTTDSELQGKISIGTSDFDGFSKIAKSIKDFREKHTAVSFEIFSGNAFDVMEKLDSGVSDFGVLLETAQISRYDYIKLGTAENGGF
ncbi:LysR family transcriptional regulator [Treponema parvum]|uniref:LysR family transcriptional regulator n=1 Tax=Treponema parvum TaxID=138851 RepID=A0A975EXZ0_9SPIR|nr:LysR family transcriptional regulator [Treponema parvum]QTQ10837.1 LysR family transcriptional regulator [Treponema parvum]